MIQCNIDMYIVQDIYNRNFCIRKKLCFDWDKTENKRNCEAEIQNRN